MNNYKQKFYSALKDTFVGTPIKGKSGFVNIMQFRSRYFDEVIPLIKELEEKYLADFNKDQAYEKLYTFFKSYLNETGTPFFNETQIHKNLYDKIYSDRDDVSLFWKTKNLYYVKSEALYDDLETEVNNVVFKFDASQIKHTKGNEKKSLEFYLVNIEDNKKKELTFRVQYKEQSDYSRINELLGCNTSDLKKIFSGDNFPKNIDNPNITFKDNGIDYSFFSTQSSRYDVILVRNNDDVTKSVTVEIAPSKIENIIEYLNEKTNIILSSDDIEKAFSIYKKQNEVDYFIHKDAEKFLKEQFDIYMYNWLFNDLDTQFDEKTVEKIQSIKKVAYEVISYIAKFEDELKAIWEKPKFVRKSNYVFTLDRFFEKKDDGKRDLYDDNGVGLVKKIINSKGFEEQVREWQKLYEEWKDEEGNTTKKEWKEFKEASRVNSEEIISKDSSGEHLNEKYRYLPIDTKFFEDIRFDILSYFKNLDDSLDGTLIKSDNWQALNILHKKYQEKIQSIYIDPPFNKESEADYDYKVDYKDSTWITILENRIYIAKSLLRNNGNFFVRCDYNGNYLVRNLMNYHFNRENFKNELIVNRINKQDKRANKFNSSVDSVFFYSKNREGLFNSIYRPLKKRKGERWHAMDSQGQGNPLEIFGYEFTPPEGRHWTYGQENIIDKEKKSQIRIKCRKCDYIHTEGMWTGCSECGNKEDVVVQYKLNPTNNTLVDSKWTDIPGYSFDWGFKTENSETLMKRIIECSSNENDFVLDFFMGSGTFQATAHKLNRKWLGVEIGDHFYNVVIPRMKAVFVGKKTGISNENSNKYTGGGAFKYYELEQYEDTLSKARYKGKVDDPSSYSFTQEEKLLDAMKVDKENEKIELKFDELYDDIDMAETLSNLIGKRILQRMKNKVIYEDGMEVDLNNLTLEKYPFLKPLIWWKSKE